LFHFPHWLIIIKYDLYLPFLDSLVHHHWAWFVLFDYTLHWFYLTGRGSYCFTSWVTGSLLLGRLFFPHTSLVHHYLSWSVLWFQASLVHHYWKSFVLPDYTVHWFFFSGQGLHCLTSCFTGSFLRSIVCIFSLPSLVHLYWAWFVLFPRTLQWFFVTWHGINMFTSLTGSSLLGMICTVALPSLVHHYWAWFVLFHFMLHWFFITGHGLCWFTSCFTCSSSLGMICTVSLPSLVDHYWAWFVLFDFPHWFIVIKHDLQLSFQASIGIL
jgi:hypothetical protein